MRTTPFSKQVGKAVDQNLCPSLFRIIKKQTFPRKLRLPIRRMGKPAGKRRLYRTGKHHRTGVATGLQAGKQTTGKSKIAGHKFRLFLRAVHTCQVKYKITGSAIFIQCRFVRVHIIFINFFNIQTRPGTVFTVTDVFQILHQVPTHEAGTAGN